VVDDHRPPLHPDRPTILTFYIPFEKPGTSIKGGRGADGVARSSYQDEGIACRLP
jgi:hypothetical protein